MFLQRHRQRQQSVIVCDTTELQESLLVAQFENEDKHATVKNHAPQDSPRPGGSGPDHLFLEESIGLCGVINDKMMGNEPQKKKLLANKYKYKNI